MLCTLDLQSYVTFTSIITLHILESQFRQMQSQAVAVQTFSLTYFKMETKIQIVSNIQQVKLEE